MIIYSVHVRAIVVETKHYLQCTLANQNQIVQLAIILKLSE